MIPALTALIPVLGNIFDKIIPDPKAAADAKLEIMRMAQAGEMAHLDAELKLALGQMEVNKAEAASSDPFTSRARPFILWICGCSLAYAALIEPLARFAATVWFGYKGDFPVLNTDITLQLLFALLGLGAYRTAEKIKGVAK